MMIQRTRKWFFPFLWTNLAVLSIALILDTEFRFPGAKDLLRACLYSLIFANLVAIPCMLLLPKIIERLAPKKLPQIPAITVGLVLFTIVGCLFAYGVFVAAGIIPPAQFWRDYFHTLRVAIPGAPAFGLAFLFYTSLQERVRDAEKKLHEKEIAEERNRKLAMEARLHSLESRIHPHFLFNTLNSISSLIPANPEKAERLVGRLADLLRSSLDTANQPLISVEQELAIVENYCEIEQARFAGKLQGRVDVPLELREAKVPPLSIQSLVENAVKHGITPQKAGGEFLVTAFTENGKLHIEVSDTGPGFDLTAIRAGHGLDNLVGRLDALFGPQARLNVLRRDGRCVAEMVLPRL